MSFLSDLASVLKQDAAKTILPVLAADLADVKANPADYLNPLTQPAKLMKLQGDLANVVPELSKDLLGDGAGLLLAYVQKVQIPAAQAAVAAATPKTA
jgi:hypothetical protein